VQQGSSVRVSSGDGTGSGSCPTAAGTPGSAKKSVLVPAGGRRPTATRGLVARAVVGSLVPGGALIHPRIRGRRARAPVTFRSARADGTRRGGGPSLIFWTSNYLPLVTVVNARGVVLLHAKTIAVLSKK